MMLRMDDDICCSSVSLSELLRLAWVTLARETTTRGQLPTLQYLFSHTILGAGD